MSKEISRRAFSVLEILMGIAALTILISLAVVSYAGYIDRADQLVDETNEKILEMAVRLNAADTGTTAGSLSELRPIDMQRAYAQVTQGKRPYTLQAHLELLFRRTLGSAVAEAEEFLPARYYNQDLSTIACRKDSTPPTGFDAAGRPTGGVSYQINSFYAGKPISFLQANPGIVIFESDGGGGDGSGGDEGSLGSDVAFRHHMGLLGTRRVAVATTTGGKAISIVTGEGAFRGNDHRGRGSQNRRGGAGAKGGRGGNGEGRGGEGDGEHEK